MDTIFNRTSVRQFSNEPVTDEQVERLMRAAMAAPSAGNQQPWEFYLTRDAHMRQRLAEASPYAKPAAAAPLVIVACTRTRGVRFPECTPQDMGAAVENILLEAVDAGLGAVWMGIAPLPERMEAVHAAIGSPADIEPYALIAVGHPATEPAPKCAQRYDEGRVHWT